MFNRSVRLRFLVARRRIRASHSFQIQQDSDQEQQSENRGLCRSCSGGQWSSQSEITPCYPANPTPIKQGRLSKLEDSIIDSDDVWMEEAEVIPSILDGTDHSELIAPISVESSAEALQRLKEEQKKTYGSRRPLVKWWLQESAEEEEAEEEARKNKGWEL